MPTTGSQSSDGFGALLQRLRARAGMTQEELAGRATVSPRTISDLERGVNQTARRATALLLADALSLADEREHFLAAARGRPGPAVRPEPPGPPAADASLDNASLDDAGASNLGWLDAAVSGNFAGRQRELSQLREAWSRAAAGRRALALVGGEPGIGKSALVGELAKLVRADKGLVLYGRWDEDILAPYQALREALADYARACPEALLRQDLDGLAGEIARVCPEPAARIGVVAAGPLAAAEAERFRLFEAIDSWIQRLGARHPVLLVLDDLQWADLPALLLLSHLVRAPRATPLLVVAMYRDSEPARSELSGVLHNLSRDVNCQRVTLRGLDHEAVTMLLAGTLFKDTAGRPLGDREAQVAAELERDTGGNPFFLLEMARHLIDLGAFDHPDVRLDQIPDSVQDMVAWRLGRVSDGCAEVLEIASVIGERFDAALVAVVAPQSPDAAVDLLDEAARAGLITEIDDEPGYWRFSHSLSRRATAARPTRGRRARRHQQIGEALEARADAAPAELAHHFGEAASIGSADGAVRYERQAAELALKEVAAEVAVSHLRRALQLLGRFGPKDPALRCAVLLELARAHDRAGEYASRDERFAEAADAARPLSDPDELFLRAALGYGGILPATVSPDPRAEALLREALERSDEQSGPRATILARLAHWLHNQRPYAERRQLSDQSLAMARSVGEHSAGDRRTLATVLTHRGWALDGPDDVDDALAVAAEVLGVGAELSDPELRLEGLRIRVAAQFEKGEHTAAVLTALILKQLAEEVRHPEFIRLATMWDITQANLQGRFAEAKVQADELTRQLARIGHSQAQLIPLAQMFPWGLLRGGSAQLLPVLQDLSAEQPANITWPAITAWSLAETGARDKAADLLARTDPEAAAAADQNYMWWAVIVGFAGAVDLTGDERWATRLYDLVLPYAGHNATLGLASFLGAADHWLGVLAAAAGHVETARVHLEAALERHRAMESRPFTALTEETLGYLLSVGGTPADRERAAVLNASALSTAAELRLPSITGRSVLRQG